MGGQADQTTQSTVELLEVQHSHFLEIPSHHQAAAVFYYFFALYVFGDLVFCHRSITLQQKV